MGQLEHVFWLGSHNVLDLRWRFNLKQRHRVALTDSPPDSRMVGKRFQLELCSLNPFNLLERVLEG